MISHTNESIYVDRMVKCRLGTVKLQTRYLRQKFFECQSGKYCVTSFLLRVVVTHKSDPMRDGQMQARVGQTSDQITLTKYVYCWEWLLIHISWRDGQIQVWTFN